MEDICKFETNIKQLLNSLMRIKRCGQLTIFFYDQIQQNYRETEIVNCRGASLLKVFLYNPQKVQFHYRIHSLEAICSFSTYTVSTKKVIAWLTNMGHICTTVLLCSSLQIHQLEHEKSFFFFDTYFYFLYYKKSFFCIKTECRGIKTAREIILTEQLCMHVLYQYAGQRGILEQEVCSMTPIS